MNQETDKQDSLEDIQENESQDLEKESQDQQTIKNLEEKIATLEEKILRAAAEHHNVSARYEKQIQEAKQYSITNLASELIIVMDNIERALSYEKSDNDSKIKSVIDGIELTKAELKKIFHSYGISDIRPTPGDKFDFNIHNAIAKQNFEQFESGSVAEIVQVGYKIKERLLRPASVIVAE